MPTVKELQAELENRGLDSKGKKAELEERLAQAETNPESEAKAAEPEPEPEAEAEAKAAEPEPEAEAEAKAAEPEPEPIVADVSAPEQQEPEPAAAEQAADGAGELATDRARSGCNAPTCPFNLKHKIIVKFLSMILLEMISNWSGGGGGVRQREREAERLRQRER